MKRKRIALPVLLSLSLLIACASPAGDIAADAAKKTNLSIKLNKKNLKLTTKTKSYTLKATVKPAKAKVTWKSSKPKIASVSSKGKLKIKKEGKTIITATAKYQKKKKTAKCTVTIDKANTGKTQPTAANTAQPSPDATPTSAQPTGTARPTASSRPKPTPTPNVPVAVEDISINTFKYILRPGRRAAIAVSFSPDNATNRELSYTSDNTDVVSVDADGQLTLKKAGTANITVSSKDNPNITKTTSLTVEDTEDILTITKGTTADITDNMAPEGTKISDCTISSSNEVVASIKDNKISGNYIGTCNITIAAKSDANKKNEIKVRVTDDFNTPADFNKLNDAIPHGEIRDIDYPTDYRNKGTAHALAWFPPNYSESKKYNLLFCLHGGTDNEYYWIGDKGGLNDGCCGDKVLDTLYAEGGMEDTIVVFPNGVIPYNMKKPKDYPNIVPNPFLTEFWQNHYLLEFEIIHNLLPYMQENYPVMTEPEHTGICGLSMGCAQSMEIGFKHPELFDYVGCFSAGAYEDEDQTFVTNTEDAKKLNSKLKLIFFITGEYDHLKEDSMRKLIYRCEDLGLNNTFYEVAARGHDDLCWDHALYIFMKHAFK